MGDRMTDKGRGGGDMVETFELHENTLPYLTSAHPGAVNGPEPIPHASWVSGCAVSAMISSCSGQNRTWLGKSPTCQRHVGLTAKSRHIWPTGPRRADTISFPTHFCVSGTADFLQIFSKYQRYVRSNHRTNWYV